MGRQIVRKESTPSPGRGDRMLLFSFSNYPVNCGLSAAPPGLCLGLARIPRARALGYFLSPHPGLSGNLAGRQFFTRSSPRFSPAGASAAFRPSRRAGMGKASFQELSPPAQQSFAPIPSDAPPVVLERFHNRCIHGMVSSRTQ